MKVGFSKICINPPYGSPIVGYYEHRYVKGILDDLFIRAIVFDDGEKKAAVLACDLCEFQQKYFDLIKDAIVSSTDLDRNAIFINCSHTHTGPLLGQDFASDEVSDEHYDAVVINGARDAVLYAINDLKDAEIETASAPAKNISFVRRFRMKDGSVATNPGVKNPDIDHPLGTPNETVKLIKIVRKGTEDIFIVSFGTHPDSVGGELISADYMGYVCSILENAVPNTKCMFLLGVQGDVNHVNVNPTPAESAISVIDFDSVPRSIKHAEHMGRIIAGAVLSICSITQKIKADKISFTEKTVHFPAHQENDRLDEARKIMEYYETGRAHELPFKEMALTTAVAEAKRIVNLENGPMSFPFHLSAIKVGELVFAGLGGEPFTEIGNRINDASPFKETIICALTNNEGGYVPTTKAYEEGGYEAKSSAFKPGCDDIVVNGMKEVFDALNK